MKPIVIGLAAMAAIMITIPVLLAWSGSRRRLRVGSTDGVFVLRMPRGHHAILGFMAVLPFTVIGIAALVTRWAPGAEATGIGLALFCLVPAVGLGTWLFRLEARGCLRLDEFGLEKVGAFSRRRFPWGEVAKLSFNPMNNWFFLTLRGGRRVYVVEGLDGVADFAALALRRLPPPVLAASPDATEALQDWATTEASPPAPSRPR